MAKNERKKKIYGFSWNRVASLLAVDLLVFVLFGLWSIENCIMSINQTVIEINKNLTCALAFFVNLQNMIPYFIVILIINFALPLVWKEMVKKK